MQQSILVTGSSGFVGRTIQGQWSNIVLWPTGADLTDLALVQKTVCSLWDQGGFGAVLHLAAQSNPRLSYEKLVETWQTNLMGTVHLTTALEQIGWKGRFLFTSTSEVYGDQKGLLNEETPVSLPSPYVCSKFAAEQAVLDFGKRSDAETMVVRPFHHSGPGQKPIYFLPSMASQIAELPSTGGVIGVGNLNVHKNFLHVLDVIEAYKALLDNGRDGQIYNVGREDSSTLKELLELLAEKSGKNVEYQVREERYREESSEPVTASMEKLRAHTGWSPAHDLGVLMKDLMVFWNHKRPKTKTAST